MKTATKASGDQEVARARMSWGGQEARELACVCDVCGTHVLVEGTYTVAMIITYKQP